MSNKTTTDNPVVDITATPHPEPVLEQQEETVKPQRIRAFVKKHKSHLFAGAGLVALTAAAAALGRSTAPDMQLVTPLELEPVADLGDGMYVVQSEDNESN